MRSLLAWAAVASAALLPACTKGQPSSSSSPAGSASAAAKGAGEPQTYGAYVDSAFPLEKVVDAVNPKHERPYAGPKGTLRGIVRIDGDPPPDTGLKVPERCKEAAAVYGKLFRVGLDKALADAVVAVTNYGDRGYVPETQEVVKVPIHDCAPARRTYVVTYGQRMEAFNLDKVASYMPYLDGVPSRTIMVAIPQGAAVKLYPAGPGPKLYMLRDQLDSGLVAHVFVVNYATHDVTGLDGQYQIKDIPVGKVRVDVMLPVTGKSEGHEVDIHEGMNTLDLTLHFDAQRDMPRPAPASSASSKPAASAARPTRPILQ